MNNESVSPEIQAIAAHYDDISQHYEDWFSMSWEAAVEREAAALENLLVKEGVPDKGRVLDLTCGMGTQAIGLAQRGYTVTAMDISAGQLSKAREKAAFMAPDQTIEWIRGDARSPADYTEGPFDAVISFANSLPLLGSGAAIGQSLTQARGLLTQTGRLFVSMRDHTALRQDRPYLVEAAPIDSRGKKGAWLETAEWLDAGTRYRSHIIFLYTEPEHRRFHYPFPPLFAVTRAEFEALLKDTGYDAIRFLDGEAAAAFSCPVYIARPD